MTQLSSRENTWDRVLGRIQTQLSSRLFDTWFQPTRFLSEDAGSLTVRVPNPWFAEWLRSNYLPLIQDALRDVERPGLLVEFRPLEAEEMERFTVEQDTPSREPLSAVSSGPAQPPGPPHPWLNPRYTFDTFVVSSCNRFAHAAAVAVASQPTRAYNPLFIYGGVGLGKTHLMQAIGNKLGRERSCLMRYMSSEHFMNELINAIRFERTQEFKEKYRSVDLLLIDDIQFLAGKERTQEEFFHTFNTLYDAQKQIVLTSDRPPRDIPTLEERLRSRFEWGLIADIQPPDLETKVAILRKKAEAEAAVLPDDVALFIASNSKSNIRELEGALIRVIAYASMSGREITLDLARGTLRDLLAPPSPQVTLAAIQKTVANYYNLRVGDLKARNNSRQITFPRQIAMYLCKQLTHASLPEIGRKFGGKHHSTVIHAVRKIEKKRKLEKEFDRLMESLAKSVL